MLTNKTETAQVTACEHDEQTLQDQYRAIQAQCLMLSQHFQALYQQHQALLAFCPIKQGHVTSSAAYQQTLQDYRHFQHEHQQSIQHFRHMLHQHLLLTRSYHSNRNSQIQTGRPVLRKTILLGEGNERDAAITFSGVVLQGREVIDSAEQRLSSLDVQHLQMTPEICDSLFQQLFALNLHARIAHEALETDTSEAGARLAFVIHHLEELLGELAPYCQKAK
jgi:hypothetical protein